MRQTNRKFNEPCQLYRITAAIELEVLISIALEHLLPHPYLFKQSDRVQGLREIVVYQTTLCFIK
jgi:hypothetical protein